MTEEIARELKLSQVREGKISKDIPRSPWRKPLMDFGGISELIEKKFLSSDYGFSLRTRKKPYKFILHSYREVGYNLQIVVEVHTWTEARECVVRFHNVVI